MEGAENESYECATGSIPSLSAELTANFYLWEKRGRGWEVWDYPVDLEPPFRPFFHSRLPDLLSVPIIDDGRRPTFFGSLIEKASQWLSGEASSRKELVPVSDTEYEEVSPESFFNYAPLREIRIALPANQKISVESAEHFLSSLSYCAFPVSFEIIGTPDSITVQFTCREPDLLHLRPQLQAYFPDAVLSEEQDFLENAWSERLESLVVDFGLSQEFMLPLRLCRNFETDPLIGICGALEHLRPGELGLLQVLFQRTRHAWSDSILRSVTDGKGKAFFADAPEMLPLAKEKIERPLFGVVIRIAAQSEYENRAMDVARSLAGALSQLSEPTGNELIPLTNDDYDDYTHCQDVLLRQSHRNGMILNSGELVSLVHPPSSSVRAQKIVRELKKTKAVPTSATGHQLILGENVHQGKRSIVSISSEQRLRHTHVIGATGTGKSTLLLNLITQDIARGQGVGVLDPHGDLIDQILGHVPENRFKDVILFDPSDAEYPVGFNILSARTEVEKNVLASDLVALFRRFSTSWGDQMTSVLGNAILAFLESERGGTLLDLRNFLVESEFRRDVLSRTSDPEVIYYWQKEFPLLKGNPQASILTRLNTFLRTKLIRNIVSQRLGLDFEGILGGRKIFLAKLSQGLIGEENAYLLGALLVSKIHQVVMARQAKSASEREAFFLYIDEFHNFITPSLASILSGARKYHLGLILAHQELRQLWNRDKELANSVISNPGTRICFRLGDFDAQKLASGFPLFNDQDLQNLGTGEAIVRIERAEYDFNLKAFPLPHVSAEEAVARREKLISLSRQNYAMPREEIETSRPVVSEAEPIEANPVLKVVKSTKPQEAAPQASVTPKPVEKGQTEIDLPKPPPKDESKHRYLQTLIKKSAEQRGFKAVLEQPTPDGQGRVDVSLEREGLRIACEICVTTTEEQELHNIEKCLAAGYDKVIVCSADKKTLEKIKKTASQALPKGKQEKTVFLQPEDLFSYLEAETAARETREDVVKGYRVKVQYQSVREPEKKLKREAVAQVIVKAMRRMKEDK